MIPQSMTFFFFAGYGIWYGKFIIHPLFDVPNPDGGYLSPALGGFYMFLTMIILLQVSDLCYI